MPFGLQLGGPGGEGSRGAACTTARSKGKLWRRGGRGARFGGRAGRGGPQECGARAPLPPSPLRQDPRGARLGTPASHTPPGGQPGVGDAQAEQKLAKRTGAPHPSQPPI